MGNTTNSPAESQILKIVQRFQLISGEPDQHLSYFQDPQTKKQYLLRQMIVPNHRDLSDILKQFQIRKEIYSGNQHLLPVVAYTSSSSKSFCSDVGKVTILGELPQRTLEDETSERHLQKRRYNENELWTILASCIIALCYLQKNDIRHGALRPNQIFISSTGIIALGDPYVIGLISNQETVERRMATPHIYLSPEELEEIVNNTHFREVNTSKSDVFTLGMIILDAGLLEFQDECYDLNNFSIKWSVLNSQVDRFSSLYSPDLTKILKIMLTRDPSYRDSWIDLSRFVKVSDNYPQNICTPSPSNLQLTQQMTPPFHCTFNPVYNNQLNGKPLAKPSSQPVEELDQSVRPKVLQRSASRERRIMHQRSQLANYSHQLHPHSQSPTQFFKNLELSRQRSNSKEPQLTNKRSLSNIHKIHPYKKVNLPPRFFKSTNNIRLINQHSQQIQSAQQSTRIVHKPPTKQSNIHKMDFVVETFPQGSRYEGYKMNGMRCGRGRFFYQDGGMYDGDWLNNKMSGYGKLYYQNGELAYEGNWMEDMFHGPGIIYNDRPTPLNQPFNYKNLDDIGNYWSLYDGDFKHDSKEGQGKIYLSNGEFYQGGFIGDRAEGNGAYHQLNGNIIRGRWVSNHLIQ